MLSQIEQVFPPSKAAIDSLDIAKAAVLATTQRSEITDLSIAEDGSLTLQFANAATLHFPTTTEIVDWHWALTRSDTDPCLNFIVGAFEDGQLRTNQE